MSLHQVLEELRRSDRPRLVLVPDPGEARSVALLAGSFDPITVAHAALAEAAAERAELVVLVYAARALPKEGPVPAPLLAEAERLRILEAFCRRRPGLVVGMCSHGLLADQVAAARERFPGSELFLVMGSDKALQVLDPRWYEDREAALDLLFREARVLHAAREEQGRAVEEALRAPENARWRGRFEGLPVAPGVGGVSSRLVRELLRRGRDVRHLVPPEAYRALTRAAAGQ